MKVLNVRLMEYILALTLMVAITLVYGSGVFEIKLFSLYNTKGQTRNGVCCGKVNRFSSCSMPCKTYFRLCLGHYQNTMSATPSCTFGIVVTNVLGGNSINFEQIPGSGPPVFRIPFAFSWPGYFTLIVEAWNDASGNRSLTDPRNLIISTTISRSVIASHVWQNYSRISRNTEVSFSFRVTCSENHYGNSCEVSCKSRDDQFGHYTCDKNGRRICKEGWESEFCDKVKCPVSCNTSRGSCDTPLLCRCYIGWQGEDCNQCKTHPYCLHGYCRQPWQCICHEGWAGNFCDIDKNYCSKQQPCKNGGTCIPDTLGNYTCQCQEGYRGAKCEYVQCIEGYCLNKGICKDKSGIELQCKCKLGFHGKRCEHKAKFCGEIKCQNGGRCEDHPTGGQCICAKGYTGRKCESKLNYCTQKPCKNGGTCLDGITDYICRCKNGFFGRNCTLALDPCRGIRCFNGGTCKAFDKRFVGTCVCKQEFTGLRCESSLYDPCHNVTCLNDGKCSKGTENTYKCECPNGYKGRLCDRRSLCSSSPCFNGGSCLAIGDAFSCSCAPGYSGVTCSQIIPADEPSNITASKLNSETDFETLLSNPSSKVAGNTGTKSLLHTSYVLYVSILLYTFHIR